MRQVTNFMPLYLEGDMSLYLEINNDDNWDIGKTETWLKESFIKGTFAASGKGEIDQKSVECLCEWD